MILANPQIKVSNQGRKKKKEALLIQGNQVTYLIFQSDFIGIQELVSVKNLKFWIFSQLFEILELYRWPHPITLSSSSPKGIRKHLLSHYLVDPKLDFHLYPSPEIHENSASENTRVYTRKLSQGNEDRIWSYEVLFLKILTDFNMLSTFTFQQSSIFCKISHL